MQTMSNGEVNSAAAALGRLGGQSTLKKYGKQSYSQWGKKGGRPRKDGKDHGEPRVCECGKVASVIYQNNWICKRCRAAVSKKS